MSGGEAVVGTCALLLLVLSVTVAIAVVLAVGVVVARPFVDRLWEWAERRAER